MDGKRFLASNSYGTVNIDLRNAFAKVIKKVCIKQDVTRTIFSM